MGIIKTSHITHWRDAKRQLFSNRIDAIHQRRAWLAFQMAPSGPLQRAITLKTVVAICNSPRLIVARAVIYGHSVR